MCYTSVGVLLDAYCRHADTRTMMADSHSDPLLAVSGLGAVLFLIGSLKGFFL